MEPPDPQYSPNQPTAPTEADAFSALVRAVRTRIISGLVLSLPLVVTFWIIYWLYATLTGLVIVPMGSIYLHLVGRPPSHWWSAIVAPLLAVALVLTFLYFLGLLLRSSILRAIDGVMFRVPVVTTIYKALRNVSRSLGEQMQKSSAQRVVLVDFPNPGTKAIAFVTSTLQDVRTGKPILCIYVLTGLVPPAGFTLFVPEDAVTDVDWTVNQTLQVILSGGITVPTTIDFFDGRHPTERLGPIVEPPGVPIRHPEAPSDLTQT